MQGVPAAMPRVLVQYEYGQVWDLPPLNIDSLTSGVSDHGTVAPVGLGLVVVDGDSGIVAARPAASDSGLGDIGPGLDRLTNVALRARIKSSLGQERVSIDPRELKDRTIWRSKNQPRRPDECDSWGWSGIHGQGRRRRSSGG